MINLKYKGSLFARGRLRLRYYIPHVAACSSGYTVDFLLESQNRIIFGDLNAHHDSWFSESGCDRSGNMFTDQIDGTAFCIANKEYPTRITANCRSSPDETIISIRILKLRYSPELRS